MERRQKYIELKMLTTLHRKSISGIAKSAEFEQELSKPQIVLIE